MDAASLRRAVRRVELGMLPGSYCRASASASPERTRGIMSYYLMRQRLLALYETATSAGIPRSLRL